MTRAAHALDGQLHRGVILRIQESNLDDRRYQGGKSKPKFCVVLNVEDPVLYVHSTSNITAFSSGSWDTNILRIPAGSYSWFPEETIISLRTPKTKTLEQLRDLLDTKQLEVMGNLSEEHLSELNTKIRCSELLTPAQIQRMVP